MPPTSTPISFMDAPLGRSPAAPAAAGQCLTRAQAGQATMRAGRSPPILPRPRYGDEDGEQAQPPLAAAGLQHRGTQGRGPARAAAPGVRLRRWRCRRRAYPAPQPLRLRFRAALSAPVRRCGRARLVDNAVRPAALHAAHRPAHGACRASLARRRGRLGAGDGGGGHDLQPQPRLGLQPRGPGQDRRLPRAGSRPTSSRTGRSPARWRRVRKPPATRR